MEQLSFEHLIALYNHKYEDHPIPTRTYNNLFKQSANKSTYDLVKDHHWEKVSNGQIIKTRLISLCNNYGVMNYVMDFAFPIKSLIKKRKKVISLSDLLNQSLVFLINTYQSINNDFNDLRSSDLSQTINYIKDKYEKNESFQTFICDHLFNGETVDLTLNNTYQDYEECEFNLPINHWYNRLIKLQQTTEPNKRIELFKQYVENPLSTDNKVKKYRQELINFYNTLINFQSITPCEYITDINTEYKPNAFCRSLFDYSDITYETLSEFITNSIPKGSKHDYRTHDISERINGMYRRFALDIDCKKFDMVNFRCDVDWLNKYIFTKEPFSNMSVKWAIDYNFDELDSDISTLIKTIDDVISILQANIYNSSNHVFKYWYNPNLSSMKPLSIHVYFPGYCFKTNDLFGFSKFMKKSLSIVYFNSEKMSTRDSYIDTSVYKPGQQIFRMPFSGKRCMSPPREPIERVIDEKEGYTTKELIEFYKDCSALPSIEDEYHSFFELYEDYEANSGYVHSKTEAIPRSVVIDSNITLTSKYANNEIESESYEIPRNGSTILINMMIKAIRDKENRGINYIDHRALRLTFVRNCYALGLNSVTTVELNKRLGIHHASGRHEDFNNRPSEDINYIFREIGFVEDEAKVFEWCDSILQNEYNQPIIFDFTIDIENVLTQELLDINIFKLIARHLFINYKRNYILIKDNQQTDEFMFTEPIHIDNVNKTIVSSDLKINLNSKYYICQLQSLLKIIKPCLFKASTKKLELEHNDDPDTTYITYTLPCTTTMKTTFKDRPKAIDFMLHSMLDNTMSGLTQEQLNERVNYFESYIAYKFQHPGAHIIHAMIVKTRQGVGKSLYARLLREINPHVKDNEQLERALQQFNSGSGDNIITFFNEVADTNQHSKLKTFITEKYIPTEIKFGPRMTELNNSLKIFYTNDESFSFIDHDDRRFIVFIGTKTQKDVEQQYNTPNFVFSSPSKDILDETLKQQYFNYLISLDLSKFNPNIAPKTPSITCNKTQMIEQYHMGEDNLTNFVNTLLEHVHLVEINANLPGVKNEKCISAEHLIAIFDFFKDNMDTVFEFDDDSDKEDDKDNKKTDSYMSEINRFFKSPKEFSELMNLYKRDFIHDEHSKWSATVLGRKMKANKKITTARLRDNQLIIKPELSEFYEGRRTLYVPKN